MNLLVWYNILERNFFKKLLLLACGEKGSENAAIYGETVGGLEDNELFAIIDTNASLPVLLVTSQV